jgi:anthranilate phosphoribosyltransferase
MVWSTRITPPRRGARYDSEQDNIAMTELHPFARFVAILGRGKSLTRSFTLEEAEEAMGMILRDEVLPEQIGAFMMLLRVKEESPEEIAGFVRAARATFSLPKTVPQVDIDWSSYAGKRRQLPWFLLSVLVLARNGYRIFMHGTEGHTPGRLYTRETLAQFGFPAAQSLKEAADHIARHNLAYVPLEVLSPRLKELIDLRPVLGLRSPVHTLARMLNPFGASCMLQGIFHPGYMEIHQGAAVQLEQPHMAVFRGEGGEIERRPNKPCEVWTVHGGESDVERWKPLLPEPRQAPDQEMDFHHLQALWQGEITNDYAEAAVTGTLAIALKALGRADSMEEAEAAALTLWQDRDKNRFLEVA